MSVALVVETHSTTEDNEAGIATGWLPGRLSEAGKRQARELGDRRRDDGVDAIFTFDLERAIETVRIAFDDTEIPVFLDWRLRECNYGELNGRPRVVQDVDVPFPGGESWREAVARVDRALDDLAELCDGQRILVIGNIAVRWAIRHRLERTRLEELAAEPFVWQAGWEYELPRR